MVHGRPAGTARKRFNDNIERFIEGEDYFKVCASEIRTHKIMDISPKSHGDIILLTENGYLMLVKSLTDDLSWAVQRQLVNTYFRAKEMTSSYNDMFLHMFERMDRLEQKMDTLEKKVDAIEKQSFSLVKDVINAVIEPCFNRLDDEIKKIENIVNISDRNIIRSVSENIKLLGIYVDTFKKRGNNFLL